jgi:hypothetical protein
LTKSVGLPGSRRIAAGEYKAPRRIAICGSAPSSIKLAPVGHPEWDIWGCSPGCAQHWGYDPTKFKAWFEIHAFDVHRPDMDAEYIQFLKNIPGPVYMIRPVPEIPNSVAYPLKEMIGHFCKTRVSLSFLASTVSYMIARAITEMPQEISFFGIDMAASSEYATQKPGCHYFIDKAEQLGIKVTAPAQSDLLVPLPPYGFCEEWPMYQKMDVRRNELLSRKATMQSDHNRHANTANAIKDQINLMDGALDDLQYMTNTWPWDPAFERMVSEAQSKETA